MSTEMALASDVAQSFDTAWGLDEMFFSSVCLVAAMYSPASHNVKSFHALARWVPALLLNTLLQGLCIGFQEPKTHFWTTKNKNKPGYTCVGFSIPSLLSCAHIVANDGLTRDVY